MACMACMDINQIHIILNHLKKVEGESKEDKPDDIYMDNISAVDMSITFKETKNARQITSRLHFVKQ
jgi:hypothetical protein